jgi:hypothetical protein
MHAGAVVLSTGNATAAAATNNAVEEYGGAASNATWFLGYDDTHLRAACIAVGAETPMAGQALYDMSILEFDLTPALSGPLVWTYVFGEQARMTGPHCCLSKQAHMLVRPQRWCCWYSALDN